MPVREIIHYSTIAHHNNTVHCSFFPIANNWIARHVRKWKCIVVFMIYFSCLHLWRHSVSQRLTVRTREGRLTLPRMRSDVHNTAKLCQPSDLCQLLDNLNVYGWLIYCNEHHIHCIIVGKNWGEQNKAYNKHNFINYRFM